MRVPVSRRVAGRLALALAAMVLRVGPAAAADLRLSIDTPANSVIARDGEGSVSIRGRLRASEITLRPTDIVLLLDASEDAAGPSGADVDGDGRVSPGGGIRISRWGVPTFRRGGSADSILAAEILTARRMVAAWLSDRTRIGIVLIASPYDPHPCEHGPRGPGATIIAPLTTEGEGLSRALDGVVEKGPKGASNLAEGIRLSASMLAGLPGTASEARPGVDRLIVFLGHRAPTFPFGSPFHTAPEDIRLAEDAARAAGAAGIRMQALAFGKGEGKVLQSLEGIAAQAGGHLERVEDPRQASLDAGPPAGGTGLSLVNETSGRSAREIRLSLDGSWTARVPAKRGGNRIRVRARAADGTEVERTVVIQAR